MTRWFLTATLVLAVAIPGYAADPAKPDTGKPKNPFIVGGGGKKPADNKPADTDDAVDENAKTVRIAHIKLSGDLSEAPVPDEALFGPPGENLLSRLGRIRKAAEDKDIAALYLDLNGLDGAGLGKINEVRQAILEFRKSGKKVFAYSESLGQKEYLVGLACDEVLVPESGSLELYGMRAEVTYYKNTLDKLHLKADVLKMGAYKSAVEPFLQDHMSEENREQVTALLDDNYDHSLVGTIVESRPAQKWTPEKVKAIIDRGPFTAKEAAKLGLVDGLAYEDDFEKSLAKKLGADEAKIERDYAKPKAAELDFSNPFALLSALGNPRGTRASKNPKIAVIYAIGGIASGKSSVDPLMGGETIGSDTLIKAIRKANDDKTVKAIVLRIDSPGGSALASDVIWHALKTCDKPIVASMGDVAASGGYYIAMPCAKIYAEPGTVTGSIGVFGLKLVTGGLEKWAGMNTEVVSRGKNSGIASTTFEWTESERDALKDYIEETYDQFIDKTLAGRKAAGVEMTRDELLALAGGRVWTGRQAKANGLVDELGTLKDAIGGAKKLAGIDPDEKMELLILPKALSFFEQLMEGEQALPFGSLNAGLTTELAKVPGVGKALQSASFLLRLQRDPVKAMMPLRIEFK